MVLENDPEQAETRGEFMLGTGEHHRVEFPALAAL